MTDLPPPFDLDTSSPQNLTDLPFVAQWGSPYTPLLPIWIIENYGGLQLPEPVVRLNPAVRTVEDLRQYWDSTSEPLDKKGMYSLVKLAKQAMPPSRYPVLPSGVSSESIFALPLKRRTRNALLESQLLDGENLNPISVGQLLRTKNFGITSLIDLMCLVEAALANDLIRMGPDIGSTDDLETAESEFVAQWIWHPSTSWQHVGCENAEHDLRFVAQWGSPYTPLLPIWIIENHGDLLLPESVTCLNPVMRTVRDLRQYWDSTSEPLTKKGMQSLVQLAEQIMPPSQYPVLPAGVSSNSIFALPLKRRTRNALLKSKLLDGENLDPISVGQLLRTQSFGITSLIDLMCLAEAALANDSIKVRPEIEASVVSETAETEAETGEGLHSYILLSEWIVRLSDRDRFIFDARIGQPRASRKRLQDLANKLGLSRERVRQLEASVRARLLDFVASTAGRPIQQVIDTLRTRLSVAAPSKHAEPVLMPFADGKDDYGPLILDLADYEESRGWLVQRSTKNNDPTSAIQDMADEVGRIDQARAAEALTTWGLDSEFHQAWLVRDQTIRSINGHLVRWDGPISDKLAFALSDIGKPATAEALLVHIDESRPLNSAKVAMAHDDRFIRANPTDWALLSWGLPEYKGIASTIGYILKQHGQPMRVDDVIERLCRDFEIEEKSVRLFCGAAMFVVEESWIRLRREHERYVYRGCNVRDATGVFDLGNGRVSLLYKVDSHVLRGSGQQLNLVVGALLDLTVDDRLRFSGPEGVSVSVTFPGTSIHGPSLGSFRSLAEKVNAKLGDMLTVILDIRDKSVSATATDISKYNSGWALVARLTGISENSGIEGLAAALTCSRGEVRATLRRRGDTVVLDALPKRHLTTGLEEALAALDAEMQREGAL